MGEKNTQVFLTILRGDQSLELTITRKVIHSKVAEGRMLQDDIG
jgi:C-terminal processing protease CtpA/Prc